MAAPDPPRLPVRSPAPEPPSPAFGPGGSAAGPPVVIHSGTGRREAEEYVLCLTALGIPHRARRHAGLHVLEVPESEAERAAYQLERYARENRHWPPVEAPFAPLTEGWSGALAWSLVLILFYSLQQGRVFSRDWLEAGVAWSEAIRAGQVWRCFTALTLHGDLAHLAGNVLFGAFFGTLLAHTAGHGRTWFGAVLAGALGNLANAFLQDGGHHSIGASTAVFGILGMLTSTEWLRRTRLRHVFLRRVWPLLAGVVMLGWFGMSGQDTDVVAHVTGMGAGTLLGIALEVTGRGRGLPRKLEWTLIAAAPLTLVLAWILALN